MLRVLIAFPPHLFFPQVHPNGITFAMSSHDAIIGNSAPTINKRGKLPYFYQDLFPQAGSSPKEQGAPSSIAESTFSDAIRNGTHQFTPVRNSMSLSEGRTTKWKRMARRLFRPRTLDFENAVWEVFNLIVNPKKMFRNNYTYKSNGRNSYLRDDPSFLILLTGLLLVSAIAWGTTFKSGLWEIFKVILNMVLIDFYFLGLVFSTIMWIAANKLFNPQFAWKNVFTNTAKYSVNYIDWGFCFDVHCNSFFLVMCLLYVVQFFMLPVLMHEKSFLAILLGNTFYLGAIGHYFVITFYGFNSLPLVSSSYYNRASSVASPAKVLQIVILVGILPVLVLVWLLSIILRYNICYIMVTKYFK